MECLLSLMFIFSPSFGPGAQSYFPSEWMTRQCTSWDGSPCLVHERQLHCYVQRQKLGHLTRKGMLSGGWERGATGNREQTLQSAIDFTFALFCPWCCLCLHKDSLRQEMQGGAVTAIRGMF